MSNVDELPDLAGDVSARALPPPYDEVNRRVRARRMRTVSGTLAATALAVGGIAIWQNAATIASPSPAPPISQPADPAYPASPAWRQVVDGTDAHPFETEGTDDGSVAVVWRALEHPQPTFALVIREADGTVHGRRIDEPVDLTPVPGGWVGVRTAQAWFISSDGTWIDLGTPGDAGPAATGDVVVSGQYGRWRYVPSSRTWEALGARYGDFDGAYVTPDGTPVTCARVGDDRFHIRRGEAPSRLMAVGFADSCVLNGNGDVVSVLGLGDDPDGDIPLTDFLWSGDGGASWQKPSHPDLGSVTSQAVSADGTTVVSGVDGQAFVVHADGSTSDPDAQLGMVFAAGERLYALSYALSKGPLLYSDDDGATWSETTLPGLE